MKISKRIILIPGFSCQKMKLKMSAPPRVNNIFDGSFFIMVYFIFLKYLKCSMILLTAEKIMQEAGINAYPMNSEAKILEPK